MSKGFATYGPVPIFPARPIATLLLIVLQAGCGPSDERIDSWKTDPEGEAKLVAAVKDAKLAPPRRGRAAANLVEMGRGVEMESALAGFDVAERASVVPFLVPRLAAWLDLPDPTRSGDARDALFALREQAPTEEARKTVDNVLLPALVKDVKAGRERAGRNLIKTILVNIGAPAIPLLTPLLADPAVPYATPVEVIDKVAELPAKEEAGAALTKRARALTEVPEPIWPALATLGGKEAADYLMATVERAKEPDAERAANALLKLRRTPGVGEFSVRVALAETTTPTIRETLFQVAEKDASEATGKALVALIASTKDRETRTRAFAACLKAAADGKLILPALEALPLDQRWNLQQVRDDFVSPINGRPGFETRRPLFKAMESKSPLARLIGIWGIEHMGFSSDAEKISKLVGDSGAVKGLPSGMTVGREATRAIAELKKKGP
jgi:hypothetical protein